MTADAKCRERFCFRNEPSELDDEDRAYQAEQGTAIPDCVAGVMTYCDGPVGHTDPHVAGFMNGQLLIVWPVFPDADGNTPFRIQTREGSH